MYERVRETMAILLIEKRTIHVLFAMNIAQFAIIILLIIAIISLLPLKEKEPYLVRFDDAQMAFVTVEKADRSLQANRSLAQSLISSYVISRESIDHISDNERFDIVRLQSASSVWRSFEQLVYTESSIYKNKQIKRFVRVVNISFLRGGYATVDFIATTTIDNKKDERRYRAVVVFSFIETKLSVVDLNKNPTGFIVKDYSISEISLPRIEQ